MTPTTAAEAPKGLRAVIGNTLWVGVWQLSNQLPTLVALPFVARAFGPETLGIYAQMLAVGAYVILLVDFGFNFTATREAAIYRALPERLQQLAAEVFTSKLILSAITAILLLVLLSIVQMRTEYAFALLAVCFGAALTSFTPTWLFLGLERVRSLAVANAICKGIAAILVVLLAQQPEDLMVVCMVNAVAAAVVLAQSVWILRHTCWPIATTTLPAAGRRMRQSLPLFAATIAVNTYTISVVLIVNLLLGPATAGVYAIADRVRQLALGVFGPISHALYPAICRAVSSAESADEARAHRLLFKVMLAVAGAISIGLFAAADSISRLFGGEGFESAADVIRAMAFIPLVVTLTNILTTQTMLPNAMTREFLLVTIFGALVGVASVLTLTPTIGVTGAGLACLVAECFVVFASLYVIGKRGLLRNLFYLPRRS